MCYQIYLVAFSLEILWQDERKWKQKMSARSQLRINLWESHFQYINRDNQFWWSSYNSSRVSRSIWKLKAPAPVIHVLHSIFYLCQDANGGIWKLDLSFSHTTKDPEKLFSYHAGEITAIATSPISQLIASTAHDGKWHCLSILNTPLIFTRLFDDATFLPAKFEFRF